MADGRVTSRTSGLVGSERTGQRRRIDTKANSASPAAGVSVVQERHPDQGERVAARRWSDEDKLLKLTGEVYRAAHDPTHWSTVLAQMQTVIACAGGILYGVDKSDLSVPLHHAHGIPEGMEREHAERYVHIDPRTRFGLNHPWRIGYDYAFISEREMDRSEYYDWHARRAGCRYFIGARLTNADGLVSYVALQRTRRQGHVSEQDIRTFERLLPHLRQAVGLNVRLARLEAEAGALSNALHRSGTAMLLLDSQCRVVFATAAAERILAQADGLFADREGRLKAARTNESALLARLLGAAVRTGNGQGFDPGGQLALPRPSGKTPLLVQVMPIRAPDQPLAGAARAAAALMVRDPDDLPTLPSGRLRALFGLTEAEAALASALAQGASPKEYAKQAGITYETARWHLKRVFAKTETRRQADLVRLLLAVAMPG